MDIETALRRVLAEVPDTARVLTTHLNEENRPMVLVSDGEDVLKFVAVEDKLIPWPVKPPAQRVAAEGFDAHKGMGSR